MCLISAPVRLSLKLLRGPLRQRRHGEAARADAEDEDAAEVGEVRVRLARRRLGRLAHLPVLRVDAFEADGLKALSRCAKGKRKVVERPPRDEE